MNTPNKITLARICLIPLVMFFYLATFIPWGKFIAGIIFIVACTTDFLDGHLARKNNQVTNLGKFLDPIADKILIMTALILMIAVPVMPANAVSETAARAIIIPEWFGVLCAVIILARDFTVSTLRQVAATKGIVLAAEKSGKYKTALQDVTFALYFFYAFYLATFYNSEVKAHATANAVVSIIMLVLLGLATLLTITSGIGYLVKNRHVFKEGQPKQDNMVMFVSNQEKIEEIKEEKPVERKKASAKKSGAKKTSAKKPTASKPVPKEATTESKKDKDGRPYDSLIPQALELFWQKGWASTTMLQKHLGVGYPRASKIVDQMEELGLVSENQGAKTRSVLVTKEEFQKHDEIFK